MSSSSSESERHSWQSWTRGESRLHSWERWSLHQHLVWILSLKMNSIDSSQYLLLSSNTILISIVTVRMRYSQHEYLKNSKSHRILPLHSWMESVEKSPKMYRQLSQQNSDDRSGNPSVGEQVGLSGLRYSVDSSEQYFQGSNNKFIIYYSMKETGKIPEGKIDKLSYCAIPINLIFSETTLVLAAWTAFYYKYENKIYLITNWHNVTGINPITGDFLNQWWWQPDIIQYVVLEHRAPTIKWNRYNRKLYIDDQLLKPNWLIHPIYWNKVDVVAIEMEDTDDMKNLCINKQDFQDIDPIVADNVYVLGFPYNIKWWWNFPLWKKWTIATEPDIDIEGLPKIFIDTASRPWMSWSPVIYRRDWIHNLTRDWQLKDDSIIGQIQWFIWIYSWRILWKTELEAQLWIVWKKQVIEEIIKWNKLDSRDKFFVTKWEGIKHI